MNKKISYLLFLGLIMPLQAYGELGLETAKKEARAAKLVYHRGLFSHPSEENSRQAVLSALNSENPYMELDLIQVKRGGDSSIILSHDSFIENGEVLTISDLFEILSERREKDFFVSLDLKTESFSFGHLIGQLIIDFQLEDKLALSGSLLVQSSLHGVKKSCPSCLVGFIQPHLKGHFVFGINLFFQNLLETTPKDFVLISDNLFFKNPDLITYWKDFYGISFIGIYSTYRRDYTNKELDLFLETKSLDWLELYPNQIAQFLTLK